MDNKPKFKANIGGKTKEDSDSDNKRKKLGAVWEGTIKNNSERYLNLRFDKKELENFLSSLGNIKEVNLVAFLNSYKKKEGDKFPSFFIYGSKKHDKD